MSDVQFKNTANTKFFDEYAIDFVVSDSDGAELTLGTGEVAVASSAGLSATGEALLSLGIEEILASSHIATSSTPAAELTLGALETLTVTSTPLLQSDVIGFVTMGVASLASLIVAGPCNFLIAWVAFSASMESMGIDICILGR